MHELRKDPLISKWVVVLKDSMPPDYYTKLASPIEKIPSDKECLLCKENKELKEIFSIRNNGIWFTKVIANINPIFQIEGDLGRKGIGMYDRMNSIGANEIIIESPEHNRLPEDIGIEQFIKIIMTYKNRVTELEKDPRLRYTLIYKDTGKMAEKFNYHPHSQVISTPVIPKGIKEELDGARLYFQYKERCIFCDILNEELRMEKRIIMESRNFVSFVPFAPSSPFDFWIIPKRHNCAFQEIDKDEEEDLALVLMTLIKKVKTLFRDLPYSYIIHSAPNRMPRKNHWHTLGEDFHWHIEFMPYLLMKNSFEWNSEFCILTTSPEDAAKYIKEA